MKASGKPDLCFTSAAQLVRLYRARKVSPLEVMQALLARIEVVNPALNAYVTVARESALAAARAATRALGRKSSRLAPLHGVPVAIKDLTATRGIRTTWGSVIYRDHVPDEDDLVVQRLKSAGAIIVGKTNTPEFGAGGNTFNALFGATRNPWDNTLTAGGSSGGAAAAVASGMAPIAEGTDLGGSLRIPAAFCGVVGFRTTPGLVPRYPRSLIWDSLSVTGCIARTVSDVALMLSTIAGADERVPLSYEVNTTQFTRALSSRTLEGWRIAWTPDLQGLIPVDTELVRIAHAALRVLRSLGARVENASPEFSEVPDIVAGTRGLAMVAQHADKLPQWRSRMEANLVRDIEQGLALSATQIAKAEVLRGVLWQRVREFMESRDLLVLPTTAVPPFPVEQPYPTKINGKALDSYTQWMYLTYAITVTGLPAISIPCGFTPEGLPVGLQLVGRRCQDAAVLRAAAAFEAAAPWVQRVPPIVMPAGGKQTLSRPRAGHARSRAGAANLPEEIES